MSGGKKAQRKAADNAAAKSRVPSWDIGGSDVPREIFPSGRVRISLGSRDEDTVEKRRELLQKLRDKQSWTLLKALSDRRISIVEVARRLDEYGNRALPELVSDVERKETAPCAPSGDPTIPTFRDEADRYLVFYKDERRARSYSVVRSRLNVICDAISSRTGSAIGAMEYPDVTTPDLREAIRSRARSDNHYENLRTALTSLFKWRIADELELAGAENRDPRWLDNPAQRIKGKKRKARVVTLELEEVMALFRAAEGYQRAYLRMFLHVGLRAGELRHLRLGKDLDVKSWLMKIQGRRKDKRCGCVQCREEGWKPKSHRSRRTIAIPSEPRQLRQAILEYLDEYPCNPGDFVFRNPRTGGVWTDVALRLDFMSLCERAGVDYGRISDDDATEEDEDSATLHSLRHTCATALVRAGVRESIIAHLLGDKLETIVEYYIHLDSQDTEMAIQNGPAYEMTPTLEAA